MCACFCLWGRKRLRGAPSPAPQTPLPARETIHTPAITGTSCRELAVEAVESLTRDGTAVDPTKKRFKHVPAFWRRKRLDPRKRAHAVDLYKSRQHTAKEICDLMGISRATLYAYIEEFSDGPYRTHPGGDIAGTSHPACQSVGPRHAAPCRDRSGRRAVRR
ncbi:helix-turn-helix domain-containing protein [Ensifer sp. NM-2]|uniref:helix-turn-helix domain-containing protein n=1 Tax=Ensifer sp. NM-2 TaxID=2109730 RepID=UPI001304CC2D